MSVGSASEGMLLKLLCSGWGKGGLTNGVPVLGPRTSPGALKLNWSLHCLRCFDKAA